MPKKEHSKNMKIVNKDVLPDPATFKKMIESSNVRPPINATCYQEGRVMPRDPEVAAEFTRELRDAVQLSVRSYSFFRFVCMFTCGINREK